jgi:hypothetical protein
VFGNRFWDASGALRERIFAYRLAIHGYTHWLKSFFIGETVMNRSQRVFPRREAADRQLQYDRLVFVMRVGPDFPSQGVQAVLKRPLLDRLATAIFRQEGW